MIVDDGTLKVHYDGKNENLVKHQMNAKSVSTSINAIDTLYKEAYKELNKLHKHNVETEIFIEGGFQEGSLWWLFKIFNKEQEQQIRIDSSNNTNLVNQAISKVIDIIKSISINSADIVISEVDDGYAVEIDNKPVIINDLQCALLTNEKIRKALSDLVTPLNEEGIEELTISTLDNSFDEIKILKKEKNSLLVARKHREIVDTGKVEGLFYAEDLSYNPSSKWKFVSVSNPLESFSAVIVDPDFLQAVATNHEKFSKDDILELKGTWIKEKKKYTGNLSTIYTIIEVTNHIPSEKRQRDLL
ncbi:hypothetical protein Q4489_09975 [Thalassotalea sp. 1_MG-2023]|uniref:hypothetical protein n=1 Tax=Thalassotalea sp. 1_MG-2023 TaxID=3062680 RepID=UPI0026E1FC44|nr:hypothetical protein [Thalassotalea sp. 1_MG-2023]MDO6427342.1 hypothetical protein [Thalassotalea sp. 1_MG-2023]